MYYRILSLVFLCLTAVVLPAQQTMVRVSNTVAFFEALQSNRHIILEPGTYNLTEETGYETEALSWEEVYDGSEPVIKNLNNVLIEGMPGAKLQVNPRYAWVMRFINCANLTFKNLILGHSEGGYCTGGVLSFAYSANITLDNCMLFGSGTEGLVLEGCTNVSMEDCSIYECTYDLMNLRSSKQISFKRCSFHDTGEFDLITISACLSVSFDDCSFVNNQTSNFMLHFFSIDEESGQVEVSHCRFIRNQVGKLSNAPSRLTLRDNTFEDNTFD